MESNSQPSGSKERSPEQRRRMQAAWQIWLPLGLLLVIFLVSAVLAVMVTREYIPQPGLPDQQSELAKGASILLVSGVCISSLMPFMFLLFSVILSQKAIKRLPAFTRKVQTIFKTTALLAEYGGEKLSEPVINISGYKAAAKQLFRSLQFWKH